MNALTVIPQQAPAFSMSDIEKVANAIARGGLFGSKDPYAVLTLCLLAQAEGQHPAVVFRDYHIISGKPAKKADAMLRDFIAGGGKVEWHTLDDECADATFSHPAGGSARITWDKARVAQAQLGGNTMHKKYPRQMLRARVVSEGVRTVYPGATSGLYVPEEAASFDEPRNSAPTQEVSEHEEIGVEPELVREGPAKRAVLEGKYPSAAQLKKALHEFVDKLGKASDSGAIDALEKEYLEALDQCQRDLPKWWTGDGDTTHGIKGQIADRRASIDGMFGMLITSMRENETLKAYTNWRATNEALIDELDDADRRRFEADADAFESGLMQADLVRAG